MRSIEARDVILEPQVAAHAQAMFEVLSDPAIYEFENQPPPSREWLRERFARLESRRSADGSEGWLNWVIRFPPHGLIGYVQATTFPDGRAAIAYELSSAYWGRGLAYQAVGAMMSELAARHGIMRFTAVLKRANVRSKRLLERLGFSPASQQERAALQIAPDEALMCREA